ncbi:hypothetical protein D3C76_994290 [compost metagenome]
MVLVQCVANRSPVAAQRDLQQVEQLLAVHAPGGVCAAAVHQDAHAIAGQALGRQQVPGQVALFAGVSGPVQVHRNARRLQVGAQGLGEAGQLFGAFFLVAQQHEEGPQLGVFDLAFQQQGHGRAGLFTGQAARAALAFA